MFSFIPERLWVGSANGTRSSRSNLEMGVWLTDPQLLNAARGFLTTPGRRDGHGGGLAGR
jgi:hypothetical protein